MYETTYNNTLDPAGAMALFGTFGLVVLIGYVIQVIFLGMIFKKAGVEPWKAWVPFYNLWVFFELGEQKGWLSLLFLLAWIPVLGLIPAAVAFVFSCIAAYRIGINFGKDGVFVLLYIFVTIVWLIWLAVDKSTWKGGVATSPAVQAVPAGPPQASAPVANDSAPDSGNAPSAASGESSANNPDSKQ